jgi:hypothetical protein
MTDHRASNAHEVMATINRAWRENRPSEMYPYLHPDVTMVLPGFGAAVAGRDSLLDSFTEFCSNARMLEYEEYDEQIQVIGNVAVVHFRFDMLYERASRRQRSTGRDVWVLERVGGMWFAVWRTMVDVREDRQANT